MASAVLNLHAGGHLVSLEELDRYQAPEPEKRWFPLSHAHVYRKVREVLDAAGYQVAAEKLAVHRNGARFFGTLELTTKVSEGVALAVGVRNSTDRSYPIGFIAGHRIFVCSNLAFRSDLLNVKAKHTRHGEERFGIGMANAIVRLSSFKDEEARRIEAMRNRTIDDTLAESLTLRALERGIISSRQILDVIREWREPSYEAFKERTLYSYFNAVTTVLGKAEGDVQQPQKYCARTMMLHHLVEKAGADQVEAFLAS
jgi:hypothetical protein